MLEEITAKKLYDMGYVDISIYIFGIEFKIIVDGQYKNQPCLYVDNTKNTSYLCPKTVSKEYRKLSTLKKDIRREVIAFNVQISKYRNDEIKEFEKSSQKYIIEPLFNLHENEEIEIEQLKILLKSQPYEIKNVKKEHLKILFQDKKFVFNLMTDNNVINTLKRDNLLFEVLTNVSIKDLKSLLPQKEEKSEFVKQRVKVEEDKQKVIKYLFG